MGLSFIFFAPIDSVLSTKRHVPFGVPIALNGSGINVQTHLIS